MIGHVEKEPDARTFSDYLYVQGIKNEVEVERDGRWAIWVHGEDELETARSLLRRYRANPQDPEIRRTANHAREQLALDGQKERAAGERYHDRKRIFPDRTFYGVGILTFLLIGASVAVYLMQNFAADRSFLDTLLMSENPYRRDLPEVRHGEIWRVFTPVLLHFHVLHILFNMLWMKDLGSMIESRQGTFRLASLVLVISVASNLGQYFMSGPRFGGMSGVVYGLLGYIWIRGKFDPASGLYLHPSTVAMMLIWFAFCLTGFLPIANTAHGVGLGLGAAWGYLAARSRA